MEDKKKKKSSATEVVIEIKRRNKRIYSPEEKILFVPEDMREDDSITAICRRYGIHSNIIWKQ